MACHYLHPFLSFYPPSPYTCSAVLNLGCSSLTTFLMLIPELSSPSLHNPPHSRSPPSISTPSHSLLPFGFGKSAFTNASLPVEADLVFRLHHNALGCHYCFRWRTTSPRSKTCIFGCPTLETPFHLFWDCPYADGLWRFYLQPFHRYTPSR